MDLVYFVILIGSLVFVHELGHFLFAKAFGVKVLTFSLGFGPKLVKIRGRETEYCIGLLPLGGYVRMLEASKSDLVHPEDRHRTFESLPLLKRVLVVLAGPLMNLLFPVLLYFSVFVSEGPYLPPTVGVVLPGHAAHGKLMPGDRVMSVDGRDVATFEELNRLVLASPGKTLRIKVFRDNRHVDTEVTVGERVTKRELDLVEREGTIGIGALAPSACIGVADPTSPAWRAGLRTFDRVTHVAGRPVRRYLDLERALADNHGETVPITYLRPVVVPNALGGLAELAVLEAGVVALTPDLTGNDFQERTGIEPSELYVASLGPESCLREAGVRDGDRLLALDGRPLLAWSQLRERVSGSVDREHRVDFLSGADGSRRSGSFRSQGDARCLERTRNYVPLAHEARVEHPARIRTALAKAVAETGKVTRFVLLGLVRLAQGKVSLSSLAGPLTIYELAGEERRKGADYFVWVMALVSINLGLLNLLPIPALDGGHLLFFGAELVLRRPLPLRVRELAHIVGMALLLGLMTLAFKNDLESRGWWGKTPEPQHREPGG